MGEWGNFEDLRYEKKGELANANVGVDIRVTFTNAAEGWQVYVCDAASYGEFTGGYFDGSAQDEAQTVSFRIGNATVLEAIQVRGIVVKGKRVTLTKIEIVTYTTSYDAVPLTIGADGIATFSSSKHLDFTSTGVTPYYASSVTTCTVTLTAATKTRKYAGYIVQGAAGSYDIPVIDGDEDWLDAFNNLRAMNEYSGTIYRSVYSDYSGTDDNATNVKTKYRYIFTKKNEGDANIGFYKLTADHKLGAHKAYLETSEDVAAGARVALIFDDDTTTGITDLKHAVNDGIFYNMNGMRVERPAKGLFIRNGKKFIVK